MKKFLASSIFLLVFAAYAVSQHVDGTSVVASTANTTETTPTPKPTPVQTVPTPVTPTPIPTPTPQPKGKYVNGTYTGQAADAYYGTVQVQVTVSGGKIADVQFLQYPSDRNTSRYINGQAMPILISEAIQVQSAQVDGVSGASDTSGAFQQSLGSALTQARG